MRFMDRVFYVRFSQKIIILETQVMRFSWCSHDDDVIADAMAGLAASAAIQYQDFPFECCYLEQELVVLTEIDHQPNKSSAN